LVGRYLTPLLKEKGFNTIGYDITDNSGDIRNTQQFSAALTNCDGVIHLAAVSRVIWGEKNPELCWQTNALASEAMLQQVLNSPRAPWILVASSREVYGSPQALPVNEDSGNKPINIYGRSKAYMEEKTLSIREAGINSAVVRLANVYGCTEDHADRVLPAFCRNAVQNKDLRVDGRDHLFDFTHISDTCNGLMLLVEQLDQGERNLPPIHLLPGIGTTLGEAADLAISAAQSRSKIMLAPPRHYDVNKFIGDPGRAKHLLGWQASITPKQGIKQLVDAFKAKATTQAGI